MKWVFLVALVAAAIVSPAAGSDSNQWGLTGSGTGSLDLTGDHVMIGAHSDVGGTNPRGYAENQGQINGVSPWYNTGGAVVCLNVIGNRAIAIWRLRQPLVDPTFGTFIYAGAYVEDNGEPVDGQPVDRMSDFVIRTEAGRQFLCSDAAFAALAGFARPLGSGNFVVRD